MSTSSTRARWLRCVAMTSVASGSRTAARISPPIWRRRLIAVPSGIHDAAVDRAGGTRTRVALTLLLCGDDQVVQRVEHRQPSAVRADHALHPQRLPRLYALD